MVRREQRYGVGEKEKWSWVEYTLTWSEEWQVIKSILCKFIYGGRIADYMSEDLEELLCGYNPNRHRIILGK